MDWIPLLSQVKSLVQVIGGDEEGARQTQINFTRQCPVVSQTTSLVQAIQGDLDGARETQLEQMKMLSNTVEMIPVVGHAKGGIHYLCGDHEGGSRALRRSSLSTVVVGAVLTTGPIAAAAYGPVTAASVVGTTTVTSVAASSAVNDIADNKCKASSSGVPLEPTTLYVLCIDNYPFNTFEYLHGRCILQQRGLRGHCDSSNKIDGMTFEWLSGTASDSFNDAKTKDIAQKCAKVICSVAAGPLVPRFCTDCGLCYQLDAELLVQLAGNWQAYEMTALSSVTRFFQGRERGRPVIVTSAGNAIWELMRRDANWRNWKPPREWFRHISGMSNPHAREDKNSRPRFWFTDLLGAEELPLIVDASEKRSFKGDVYSGRPVSRSSAYDVARFMKEEITRDSQISGVPPPVCIFLECTMLVEHAAIFRDGAFNVHGLPVYDVLDILRST